MSILVVNSVELPRIITPRMAHAYNVCVEEAPTGLGECALCSWQRSGGSGSKHEEDPALALDFDMTVDVPLEFGQGWRDRVQTRLGSDYDVLWHIVRGRGGYHLHVEDEGRRPFPRSGGFYARVRATQLMEV